MKYLFALLAVLLVVGAGLVLFVVHGPSQSADPVASSELPTSSIAASTAAGAESSVVVESWQALEPVVASERRTSNDEQDEPLPTGDFDLIRPELESRALAGDGHAAFRLAKIYRQCVEIRDGGPKMRLPSSLSELLSPEELEQHSHIASIESQCAGLGKIVAPDYQYLYWKWVELAAELGDISAMLEYSSNVIPSWPTVEGRERHGGNWPSALGDAESIIHYRNKAAGFLKRAVDIGAPYALDTMAMQFSSHGSLFPPDPVRAYGYALAFLAVAESSISRKQAVLHLSWLADEITDEQIAQAQQLSGDILADFYDGFD